MKGPTIKWLSFAALLCGLSSITSQALSQVQEGKWSFGVHGGLNVWNTDFNTQKVGSGVDLSLRYGFSRELSLGVRTGYEELKSYQVPALPFSIFDYVKLHSFPVSISGWYHFTPGRKISPYVHLGIGGLFFKRLDGNENYMPDNSIQSSFQIPGGVGLEFFPSRNLALTAELGFSLLNGNTDAVGTRSIHSYLSPKVGLNLYLGSNDAEDDDDDRLSNGEEDQFGTGKEIPDSDGDHLKDGEEVHRYFINPVSIDTDGDRLKDGEEVLTHRTDPAKADTDEDGVPDGEEIAKRSSDPLKGDSDGDGLGDGDEIVQHLTSPLHADTDNDGLSDWEEIKTYLSDPNQKDTDQDHLVDGEEVKTHKTDPVKWDSDEGGLNDAQEIAENTDPLNPGDDVRSKAVQSAEPASAYTRALSQYRNRDYSSAVATFESLLAQKIDPDLADNCHYWMGECWFAMGKYSDAIHCFEMALTFQKSEKQDDSQFMIGNCYAAMGEKTAAKEAYDFVVSFFPKSPCAAKAREKLAHLK